MESLSRDEWHNTYSFGRPVAFTAVPPCCAVRPSRDAHRVSPTFVSFDATPYCIAADAQQPPDADDDHHHAYHVKIQALATDLLTVMPGWNEVMCCDEVSITEHQYPLFRDVLRTKRGLADTTGLRLWQASVGQTVKGYVGVCATQCHVLSLA